MKTKEIGTLNFEKFKTSIHITPELEKLFKSKKTSLATLIPTAWSWYDHELLEIIDENGDGKADSEFGSSFKVIYTNNPSQTKEYEQTALNISRTTIQNIKLQYIILKNDN